MPKTLDLTFALESEVKEKNPRTFQYIKVENEGRRYFCLHQNLAVLAWILCFKKDTLRPIIRSDTKKPKIRLVVSWLRSHYRLLKKNFMFFVVFFLYTHQLRKIDFVITLPIYGQICVPVHKGYKIFDLYRGVVAKVFDHDINLSSIRSEIERLKQISQIDFAPSLKRWKIEERWYEEEYVSGSLDSSYEPLDSVGLLEKFNCDLAPYINSLIVFQQSKTRISIEYAKEVVEMLEDTRFSSQELTATEFRKVKAFLDFVVERLRIEKNCQVYLVFTHGDFCPANMLNTSHGVKVIDWEGAGYRSALFDFYSYFFYRSVSRGVSVGTIVSEVNEAFPLFVSSLAKKAPGISNSVLSLRDIYRWLYYIERIAMLVERKTTDKNLNILEDIFRYIGAFSLYEEEFVREKKI